MKIELKPKKVVMLIVIVVIAVGGYFYLQKTAPKRNYISQIKTMRLVHEHQSLEIEIYEQQKKLAEIKTEKESKIPTYNLTPAEKEK